MPRKTHEAQQVQQKGPANRVKGFRHIHLQKTAGLFSSMDVLSSSLHYYEIVMDCPTSDKRAQVGHDRVIDERIKPKRPDLRDKLAKTVNGTYRSEVLHFLGLFFLSQKYHVCLINHVETSEIQGPKSMNSSHDIMLDDRPNYLIEKASKSIGAS
jgi:hypothetical protein